MRCSGLVCEICTRALLRNKFAGYAGSLAEYFGFLAEHSGGVFPGRYRGAVVQDTVDGLRHSVVLMRQGLEDVQPCPCEAECMGSFAQYIELFCQN